MSGATVISGPGSPVEIQLQLPASKSISNRLLIIDALGGFQCTLYNLSRATDTTQLKALLHSRDQVLDCGEGGTTFRFLIAYLAATGGDYVIKAGASLSTRPHEPLFEALRKLGALVTTTNVDGVLTVKLHSEGLISNEQLEIASDVSSQFVSALLLVAPYVQNGLEIKLGGSVVSEPYIAMTLQLMSQAGIPVVVKEDLMHVAQGKYQPIEYTVEPDWSAASYWYEVAALLPGSKIELTGMRSDSIQGDARIKSIMEKLGVVTMQLEGGLLVHSKPPSGHEGVLVEDLSGIPDTAPALIAICAGLGVTADFPGLTNFRLKETDRAAAFQRELYNFGVNTDFCGGSKFKVYGNRKMITPTRVIKSYNDHRVIMAIAPLSILTGKVTLDNIEAADKSYPGFFEDLIKAGFTVKGE